MGNGKRACAWAALVGVALAGCGGCGDSSFDPLGVGDVRRLDGGARELPPKKPELPSGPYYPEQFPAEACSDAAQAAFEEAEIPDGAVRLDVCVALRTLSGTAMLNDAPATGGDLSFEGRGYRSQGPLVTDGEGTYSLRALRGRYEQVLYHPNGVTPTHQGPLETGAVDLSQDVARNLWARSHRMAGTLTFGGVPWTASSQPYDVQITALGLSPPQQWVGTESLGGRYDVALLEGDFALSLAIPRQALGNVEVLRHDLQSLSPFRADRAFDLDIAAATLSGELTLEGEPWPRRTRGDNFVIEYRWPGTSVTVAQSFHSGGRVDFTAKVPSAKYDLALSYEATPDAEWPQALNGLPLAGAVDLQQDAAQSYALKGHTLETALSVDGAPVMATPGRNWNLFVYGNSTGGPVGFTAWYQVPITGPLYWLKAFPATYSFYLYLDEGLGADLAEGWYSLGAPKVVQSDVALPIDLPTRTLEARLLVDGVAPPAGERAGTLYLVSESAQYRRRIVTDASGAFRVRVPPGRYDLVFELEANTFPDYAIGLHTLARGVPLDESRSIELRYDTQWLAGPLRIDQEVVPETRVGPEVSLLLRKREEGRTYVHGHEGDAPFFQTRVPAGEYQVSFRIEEQAFSGVAWGTAPLGQWVRVP